MRADNGQFLPGTHWRPEAPHWDAIWLRHQYITIGRSAGDIARDAGVTDNAIHYWLHKHGIPRRSTAEARALKKWGLSGEANGMHGRTGSLNPKYVDLARRRLAAGLVMMDQPARPEPPREDERQRSLL